MEITAAMVKQLRETTGAGMMQCKQALAEAAGDIQKATQSLRKMGLASVAKRADRIAAEGRVEAYVHPGNRIGVLVEVNCETDFVARTDDFIRFCKEVALQVAATSPKWVSVEDVAPEAIEEQKTLARTRLSGEGRFGKRSGRPDGPGSREILRGACPPQAAGHPRRKQERRRDAPRSGREAGRKPAHQPVQLLPPRRGRIGSIVSQPDEDSSKPPRWKRILLKLSGEILAGEQKSGLHHPTVRTLAEQIADVHRMGCEMAIVVGGRKHLPRRRGRADRDGARQRRHDRDAGDRHQCPGTPGAPGARGSAHESPDGHQDGAGGRAPDSPAGDPPPGKGTGRDPRGGDR